MFANMNNEPVAIFSADRAHLSRNENIQRNRNARAMLRDFGLQFKPVTGMYEGETENALAVVVPRNRDLFHVLAIAAKFSQDCVLSLGPNDHGHGRKAMIVVPGDPNGNEHIGTFKHVPHERAMAERAWTHDPNTDFMFIVE